MFSEILSMPVVGAGNILKYFGPPQAVNDDLGSFWLSSLWLALRLK